MSDRQSETDKPLNNVEKRTYGYLHDSLMRECTTSVTDKSTGVCEKSVSNLSNNVRPTSQIKK